MADLLVEPSIDEAVGTIKKGIEKRKVLLIVGNCSVRYRGRAMSMLDPGQRIVIIKEDGALLIHRSTGYEPTNWMPGQNIVYHVRKLPPDDAQRTYWFTSSKNWQSLDCFNVKTRKDVLEIRAVRQKPAESVRVFFDKVTIISAFNLADSGEFSLHASEQDMQKAIIFKPDLLENGFKPISFEKKVEPGFVDVYGVDGSGKLVVVEIKRKTAGKNAVLQLAKYIDAIRSRADREVRGMLVAPHIAKDVQRLLVTLGLEYKSLDPRKCSDVIRRFEGRKLEEFFEET